MAAITEKNISDVWYGINNNMQHSIDGINYQTGLPFFSTIVQNFQSQFGRLPTVNEVNLAAPAFQASGTAGNAYIAQLYNQQNPNEQADKQAAGMYGTVDDLFKSNLGRSASDEEKQHFGSLLASKQYDQYTLGQALQNLPEHVQQADAEFRKSLTSDLQANDSRYFNEQIMPGISQNFAKSGRSFDSSGYANALAQAASGQNRERESFLSNLTANQYEGNKGNAYAAYLNNANYNQNKYDASKSYLTGQVDQYNQYNIQKQAYDQYLKSFGKRSSGNMGAIGSLAGMGIGAAFAAPTGGMSIPVGAMLGSSIGGAGGSVWDSQGGGF